MYHPYVGEITIAGNGWLKTLSFGMINVGVRLQSGARTVSVSLNGLHRVCFEDPEIAGAARLNQLYKCAACDKIVPADERLSGYALDDGRYVPLTPDEIKAQLAVKDDVLTVQALVPIASIDRLRLDKSFYVGPQAGPKLVKGTTVFSPQHRTFEMIRQGLMNADRAAIVTWADRGHEKIGVLFPQDVGCLLYEAFFSNEIPVIADQFKPEVFTVPTLTTKETGLGALLFQGYFSDDFDWTQFEDGYVARVHALALAKADGQAIELPDAPSEITEINNLEAALEAALAAQTNKPPQPMPAAKPTSKAGKKEQAA